MGIKPSENAIHSIDQMLFFLQAVRFTRVNDKLALDAVSFEGSIKHLTLTQGIGAIVFAVKDQCWSPRVLDVSHRRTLRKTFRLIIRKAINPFVIGRTVFCAKLHCQVAHPGSGYRRFESLSLSDRPRSH